MYDLLVKLAPEFGLLVEDEKKTTELEVIGKLNKSMKLDEIDTVTFGLETDDGKIVKVYVNAEQAEEFEKALAEKLGKVDSIEDALNDLSKDFEIVDVEWPDEGKDGEDPDAGIEDTGADVLNKDVYKNAKETEEMDKNVKRESMELGDEFALSLMENDVQTLESRFTTATQLMIYHAIIDLGIPEVALVRNPYRAAIIRGIKNKADEMIKNAGLKSALKMFIKRTVDYDEKAKENEVNEKEHPTMEMQGIAQPTVISEESCDWSFENTGDVTKISCKFLNISLDDEETEKLIKGVTNKDAVVTRDSDDRTQKFVFSPRGSSILVKRVGTADGYMMTSKDVDAMLAAISPERSGVEDEDEEDAGK